MPPSTHPPARLKVTLSPHQADWAPRAAAEARRWAEVLGENLLTVHHMGSTAIPGIAAKPIIDLMPEVRDLAALDAAEPAIRALGYDWRGEFGLPGRRFCLLTDARTGTRLFHVHAYQAGSSEIDRHLAFRDYLRAHRDEALAYEARKRAAAAAHPDDSMAYNGAKSDWVVACQARALAWWRGVSGRP